MVGILSLIVQLIFMYTDAYIDDEHLDDNDWIEDHSSRVAMRMTYVVTCSLIHYGDQNLWIWVIIHGLIYMSMFDPILNLKRGHDIFHVGTTAETDRLLSEKPYLNYIGRPLAILLTIYLILHVYGVI